MQITSRLLRAAFVCSLCFACPARADVDAQPVPSAGLPVVQVMARGLDHPWSLAFLPDGRQLITERAGRLRILDGGELSDPVAGVPAVLAQSQAGLFDVVLHPDFADNSWIYLSLAHGTAARNATQLVRARWHDDALVDVQVLFTAQPFKDTPVHFGGRVAFLPDGTLLLSIGDGFDYRESAQRLDSHLGKVVRLHDDGRVPDDNPFINTPGALPEIYSYGHRNPQGLAVDAATGRPWLHEHGPAGGDELNRLVPGGNYGWPVVTRGRDYSGAAISPFQSYPGMRPPAWDWTPSIAPSGLAMLSASAFPALDGQALVGALKSQELLHVSLDEAGLGLGQGVLLDGQGRLRDVRQAPDGGVWLLTDATEGRVLRLTSD